VDARLKKVFPFLEWIGSYKREWLRGDLAAGLTTAVMLVPQGMAYAMLAGLPPIVGLYASTIPLVVYALFGSSRQLAVGPVAMVSLLVLTGVSAIAEPGTQEFIGYAVLVSLLVGVLQAGMGLMRAGFLVNFLSHPVVSGFTSAAALIIGLSQLQHLLGVKLTSSKYVHVILMDAAARLGEVHLITFAIGAATVVLLMALKKYRPTFPGALAVVVLGTLAVWGLGLADLGVKIVGDVPAGLPSFSLPSMDGPALMALLPTAITIALVGFMESISVAKALASKRNYEVQPNQELMGLGLANVAGSMFGAFPVTGGFSRSAVNAQAGANTGLASLLTAGFVALALVFLTPLFFYLPKAVLAGIIMTAVFGLVDVHEVKHLWKVKRSDLALLGITFAATLALGIEEGIGVGVVASLLWFVVRTTRPHFAVLGRLPGTDIYRNVKNFPEAETWEGLLMLRVDAQFYFGNVTFLKDTLRDLEAKMEAPLRWVVIDASSINQLDSSADTALHDIARAYSARGVELYFARVKGPVREVMQRSGFYEALGPDRFYFRVHDAVNHVLDSHRPPRRNKSVSPVAPVPEGPLSELRYEAARAAR
jgi:SulP family sulfate permease